MNDANDDRVASDPARWMEVVNNHNRAFGRCTLREVAMPGSHNAGTAALTRRISKHAPTIYKAVPGFIRRWSVCQSLTVGEQLRAGSRYIDIRSAVTSDGKVVNVHANVGRPVEEALSDIAEFINTTTHEVVIVDFQHFYNFRDSDHDAYAEKIRSIFDHERIADKKTYQGSLEQMWKGNRRIVVLYAHVSAAAHGFIPRSAAIYSPWAGNGKLSNAGSRRKFKKVLEDYMTTAASRNKEVLFVLQCVSGPSTSMILRSLLAGGFVMNLKSTSKYLLNDLPRWFNEWTDNETFSGVLNIILLDFVAPDGTCRNFIDKIIALNISRLL